MPVAGSSVWEGTRGYSAGGYYGTPVERLLPVTMDVKSEVKIPTLAVTIVIDKSGSMSNEGKLDIAKSAAFSAIEVLNPLDRVAVLSFDVEPEWSVPPSEVGNRRAIVEKLRLVDSGGELALPRLAGGVSSNARAAGAGQTSDLLSDGLTDSDTSFDAFAKQVADDGITISTVAFGSNADVELMEKLPPGDAGASITPTIHRHSENLHQRDPGGLTRPAGRGGDPTTHRLSPAR